MAKIKLTKTELKTQRDALKRFSRYLPTLQLKKQQLQLETRRVRDELAHLEAEEKAYWQQTAAWIGLLDKDLGAQAGEQVKVVEWDTGRRNIAGVDTPVFEGLDFAPVDIDLFASPLILDDVLAAVRGGTEYRLRHQLIQEQLDALDYELRVTTQRVNLFEKVKIPEARENIRTIQICLGDEQTSAVGRAKIAKGKARAAAGGAS